MTFQAAPATRRTFYIERYGDRYELVRVFEPGYRMSQADIDASFMRVLETNPDERIVAEQSVSVQPGPNGPRIVAHDPATAQATLHATEHLLRGDKLE